MKTRLFNLINQFWTIRNYLYHIATDNMVSNRFPYSTVGFLYGNVRMFLHSCFGGFLRCNHGLAMV